MTKGLRLNKTKRLFDLVMSTIGLLVLSPLLGVITLSIKLTDNGPVFFRQERVGYRGKHFYILKFRTMVVDAERLGTKITVGNDPRITKVGRGLRKYKLDELPQLINVFKGEMSFVGPRPEVPKYVELYTPEQSRVLHLIPGITDPASIKYRDESSILADVSDAEQYYIETLIPDKIRVNLAYARGATFLTDLRVIFATLVGGASVQRILPSLEKADGGKVGL